MITLDEIIRAKKELRGKILHHRSLLSPDIVSYNSNLIIDKIKAVPDFQLSTSVMCYIDFGNEIWTKGFIRFCLGTGKRVVVPIIMTHADNTRAMKASELFDLDQDLESGTMGILEPKTDRRRFVEPSEIDFIVTPGLAFDHNKNRLGYGAGFYDKFFTQVRDDCRKIAVSYDFQVFDTIPVKDHDMAVDQIITETRII